MRVNLQVGGHREGGWVLVHAADSNNTKKVIVRQI